MNNLQNVTHSSVEEGSTRKDIEQQLAHLTGEKLLCQDRLEWLDLKIASLQQALKNFYEL